MLDVYSALSAHVRRPSCPPDMAPTLSTRSTFIPMEDQIACQRHASIAGETDIPAACTLAGRPKSKSLTTLQMVGRSSFSAMPSPELRRKHWLGKILRLRWDVEKIRIQFKKAGNNIRGGMQAVRRRLSPAGTSLNKTLPERSIVVDFVKDKYHRRSLLLANDGFADLDHSETNFSSSMVLTSLNNGKFNGVISLDYLPLGDIRILVSNYKLEIILVRKTVASPRERNNKVCRPRKIGDIDIPIYVNPASLSFKLDEDNDSLLIEGITKGYFEKCLSMSTNDIRVPKDYASSPVSRKKKKKSQDTIWYTTNYNTTNYDESSPEEPTGSDSEIVIPRESTPPPQQHTKIQAHRTRSNTR